jgi:hypothetical protein
MSVAATPELQALQAALLDWSKRTDSVATVRAMEQGHASPDLSVLQIIGPDEIVTSETPAQVASAACEQLAASLVPGPVLPTLLAALLGVPAGVGTVAVAYDNSKKLVVTRRDDGTVTVTGEIGPVLCADSAGTLVLGAGDAWFRVDPAQPGVTVTPLTALDFSRGLASVRLDGACAEIIDGLTTERVRDLAATLFAAEAAGIATWCSATATAYAKTRRQFGKLIGEFQAIRHLCAWMSCRAERAGALAWDAARAADEEPGRHHQAAAAAAARVLDDAVENAKDCIQVLGGIGFTWEHDAHLYLRRALAIRALLAGDGASGRGAAWIEERGDGGSGHLLAPASDGANELGIGAWAIPAITLHGTQEQQDRFIAPTMNREIIWCQLFSEPEAGSDLAGLRTRAVKTDGGWRLTGQKVWTSLARQADWAICLARTDPDVPKRQGLSYFAVDMHADGVEVRPLREITGRSMFNEVFLDDVFVADDCLIGAPGDGWKVAMSTLATERETIGGGDVLAQRGVHPAVRKLLGVAGRQDDAEASLAALGPAGAIAGPESTEFLLTRCLSIAGGTTQILLNQVAERVLGLPKDPR